MKRHWNKTLLRQLLGELPTARIKALDARLAEDAQLQQKRSDWQAAIAELAGYQPDFEYGFERRVLQRLTQQSQELFKERIVWRTMLRFSISAVAAVILLFIWVYFQEQSLSIEHLLGLAGLKTDDFANLLANY
jgi:anti-sigma factor RsiW